MGGFDFVGVDAWSIGCVEVRFKGDAERGVRGDEPGRELVDLMGVRRGGEGDGVGVLDLGLLEEDSSVD